MLMQPYQSHIWRVPKDDIYQALHALRLSRDYIISHINQMKTSPAVGIRKRLLEISEDHLKQLDAAIVKLNSSYQDADLIGQEACGTKFATAGWTCTRVNGHTGPCAAIPLAKPAKHPVKVPQQFYTCKICLRSKFTRLGQPHRCQGGYRKRFGKYARQKGWDSCFFETPKSTSSIALHLSGDLSY